MIQILSKKKTSQHYRKSKQNIAVMHYATHFCNDANFWTRNKNVFCFAPFSLRLNNNMSVFYQLLQLLALNENGRTAHSHDCNIRNISTVELTITF